MHYTGLSLSSSALGEVHVKKRVVDKTAHNTKNMVLDCLILYMSMEI